MKDGRQVEYYDKKERSSKDAAVGLDNESFEGPSSMKSNEMGSDPGAQIST